jgi:hypothetical protein
VWRLSDTVVHLIVGEDAAALAAALQESRGETAMSRT